MDSNFELIDKDLELKLKSIIESCEKDNTLVTDDGDIEIEELIKRGLLHPAKRYIDGTIEIKLTYDGLKYFKRKDQYKSLERKNTVKGAAGTIAEKATEVIASAAFKHIGM